MKRVSILPALLVLILVAGCAGPALQTSGLRCEYLDHSLEIDAASPRLNWILTSDQCNQAQTAYQIQVASSLEKLAANSPDLWDSGKVTSTNSIRIPYGGQPLQSRQECFWKVRVWDKDGHPSKWSEPAQWSMGIVRPQDWRAKWISQAGQSDALPIFRKEFTVTTKPNRAIIYLCGLGQFELHINGQNVSDDFLQPGWTDYRKTCLYVAYDVTSFIKPGQNAIGVLLGNGMYSVAKVPGRYTKLVGSFGPPKLIGQLFLDDSICIATDTTWKASPGPITFSHIYGGEDYDARLEQAGWDEAGFDDSHWASAAITDGPGGSLSGSTRAGLPIRVARIFDPVKITPLANGDTVYDLGQNCSIVPQITVNGSAGATVRLYPSELLAADGTANQRSSGPGAWDSYTLSGKGDEIWSSKFNYRGCRYFQVHITGDAKVIHLEGQFITSTSPVVGQFACSNDLFNRTATLIDWAIRSNMVSTLTDCPHRERLGWLEQDHLMGPSILYNYDVATLLSKICGDIRDAQHADGLVPEIAPEYTAFKGGFLDSPEWGSACILVPWSLYQWYGDVQVLVDSYDSMKRYVAYLASRSKDNILSFGLGDWYDLGPKRPGFAQLTTAPLTATAFYYRDLKILADMARVLGHEDDAKDFDHRAQMVADAFNKNFYHPSEHYYATNSQTGNALPVVFGIAPVGDVPDIVNHIVKDMQSRGDGLTAGDVGYRFVLQALADNGQSEEIFKVNNQSSKPGYGYQLAHGATSLTEAWNAASSSSQNHFMLGHILEWFYRDLAGIQAAPGAVAFDHIWIKPAMVGDIVWTKATYNSIRGPITSDWTRNGTNVTLNVSIPIGSNALVYVPAASQDRVWQYQGKFLRMDGSYAVYKIGSGNYKFAAK